MIEQAPKKILKTEKSHTESTDSSMSQPRSEILNSYMQSRIIRSKFVVDCKEKWPEKSLQKECKKNNNMKRDSGKTEECNGLAKTEMDQYPEPPPLRTAPGPKV